jgi:branched-chain amino acid transport system ATP-binding protein
MLRVRNLDAGYGSLAVLKNISIHVDAGEIVAIIGANGAGKTTLLKTISGIVKAQSGAIGFKGNNLRTSAGHAIVAMGCSLVPEGRQVFPAMTVGENLILGAYTQYRRRNHDAAHETMLEVFRLFPVLKQRRHQLAGTLSGGEQQMLAIGRAMMAKPDFIMLDEPSMGLAPLVIKTIFAAISSLRARGKTILVVEQNAKAILKIASRGYVMETGSLVLEGTGQELLANRDVQRAYLGKEYSSIADEREGT